MDQSKKPKTCSESDVADDSSASSSSAAGHNMRAEMVVEVKKEAVCSQKAEAKKLRRDKLKEHFLELGNALDPSRRKSDKVSILTDTIQMLKDVMNQVDRLNAEYATLSEESRQLIEEKSELREEKATLKSDIEILNARYQHRVRTIIPWIPHYTYRIPVLAITKQTSIQKHLSLSSAVSNKQDSIIKSLDLDLMRNSNHSDQGNDHKDDVGLELELKLHASSSAQQDVSGKDKKESSTTTANSSNSYSSSQAVQDSYSSSCSINEILKS